MAKVTRWNLLKPCCCFRWSHPGSRGWSLIWSIRRSTWATPPWPGSMSVTPCAASQASPCPTWRTPSQSAGVQSWIQCEWWLCWSTALPSHTSASILAHTHTIIHTIIHTMIHTIYTLTYHIHTIYSVCVKSCQCVCNGILQLFSLPVTSVTLNDAICIHTLWIFLNWGCFLNLASAVTYVFISAAC